MKAKILSNQSNSVIAPVPGRHYPGIIIQGDTVSNLFDHLREIYSFMGQFPDEQTEHIKYTILSVLENLENHLRHYECTLEQQEIKLPYHLSIEERSIYNSLDSLELIEDSDREQ